MLWVPKSVWIKGGFGSARFHRRPISYSPLTERLWVQRFIQHSLVVAVPDWSSTCDGLLIISRLFIQPQLPPSVLRGNDW